ncbi:hypothetical protein [Nocardioides albus]|uniref:Uncharacterized protein n=1 Tax=Nocardioides albus TaxID=1841 RepID=A0A7W5A8X4_9ACTN|nr:hypothetical protein [Nocardioides albus]MBB3091791.1 hypothetical protein [Nocardioides albus]GGU31843.1 hypothetical protein GCM10007979_33600 [Nocardioides albus]
MKSRKRMLALGVAAGLMGAGAALASTASAGISAEQKEQPVVVQAEQKEQPVVGNLAESHVDLNLGM